MIIFIENLLVWLVSTFVLNGRFSEDGVKQRKGIRSLQLQRVPAAETDAVGHDAAILIAYGSRRLRRVITRQDADTSLEWLGSMTPDKIRRARGRMLVSAAIHVLFGAIDGTLCVLAYGYSSQAEDSHWIQMFCASIASSLLFTEFVCALTWGLLQVYRDFCTTLQSCVSVGYEHLIALDEIDDAFVYLKMMREAKDSMAQIEPLVRLMPKLKAERNGQAMDHRDIKLEALGGRERGAQRGKQERGEEAERKTTLARGESGLC